MKSNITNLGLNPEEVLGKGKQFVHVENDDQGFADNEEDVLNQEFEKMYDNFMNSDYVKAIDNDENFQKCKDSYDTMSLEGKKQFLKHCLIDMITLHMNELNQINQIQQSLFVDDYSNNVADSLDARWMDIFIYQLAGLAFSHTIPGPMMALMKKDKGE